VKKDEALSTLASAREAAVEAESAAAAAQDRKRAAVRQTFDADCTAPEVAAMLGSSAQWAYQLRNKPPLNAA
jgi:hypothetical protein